MLMGTAVHAGLAAGWKWGEVPRRAVEAAFAGGWPEDAPAEHDRNALEAQALRVLGAVTEWCAREMPDAEPLMVEEALGTDGHTTPDLVTREGGQLVITDWKYSHHVPADRIHYRLEGPERVHQFWHYVWAVGEHLKEPVALFRKVVIVGGPKIVVKDATFRPTPEGLAQWLAGAKNIWSDMEAGRVAVEEGECFTWQNPNGCKPYGDKWPCSYWDACWTCYGDRKKMENFYGRSGA